MYTMHFDHSHKTAVHTELLQDLYLSVDAKGLAAILCSFGKDAFELYGICYLDVWEEGNDFHLKLRGM